MRTYWSDWECDTDSDCDSDLEIASSSQIPSSQKRWFFPSSQDGNACHGVRRKCTRVAASVVVFSGSLQIILCETSLILIALVVKELQNTMNCLTFLRSVTSCSIVMITCLISLWQKQIYISSRKMVGISQVHTQRSGVTWCVVSCCLSWLLQCWCHMPRNMYCQIIGQEMTLCLSQYYYMMRPAEKTYQDAAMQTTSLWYQSLFWRPVSPEIH